MNALSEPDFRAPVEEAMTLSLPMINWIKYFPIIKLFTRVFPPSLITLLKPGMKGLVSMRRVLTNQVKEVTTHPEALTNAAHPIIYHELLNPAHGKTVPSFVSLRDEALLLVYAGTDTASNTLTLATVHILSKPSVHEKLRQELLAAWPDLESRPRFEVLDNLPYLVRITGTCRRACT